LNKVIKPRVAQCHLAFIGTASGFANDSGNGYLADLRQFFVDALAGAQRLVGERDAAQMVCKT
jgi:hypothetical protein